MKIDIIGDVHGCLPEFKQLTIKLGYSWDSGIPLRDDRVLGFVGDITDRGPNSLEMIEIVWKLWKKGRSYYVPGNHCNKLYRYFLGRNVRIAHGLETTVAELNALSGKKVNYYKRIFIELYEGVPLYARLDLDQLIIAHAGIRADYIGRFDKSVKTFVLYGDITGEFAENGMPIRLDWAQKYTGDSLIVYGHTPVHEPRRIGNTINIDTGAVFGGELTAFKYPELETVSVQSSMPYIEEKFRVFDQ
ncbi:bis(5'-nucleosyl)-tetraphosphatase PrpE [Bacillus sp. FJAT-50079]|uniref:bis(5'-nucleosyl)-tetraphosphatase PrpE n=1 Tax=Bacillus sp. FJAT-50079 TaxID=2833577 RepID=UPI001BCA5A45|nr:bis(5'-nucleosyl)-tetraphosphatase PrpE [Bacillus sp. FJAT-50079]MBS4207949.1 bis(5'-nucleosyl)-tetraphosphatase PrpE [Bacillus sp. FJAT-50079]